MRYLAFACAVSWCVTVPAPAPAQAWVDCQPAAVAVYHGWYQVNGGWELWWKGERIGLLSGSRWLTEGKSVAIELRNAETARCCCGGKCGPCKCAKCPEKCDKECDCDGCGKKVFFGVDASKRSAVPRYSHCGRECTRSRAIEAIFEDESAKRRITVIGDDAFRKKALAAIGSPTWAVVKAYPADHWYVTEQGFVPGVYIQEPDGTVIHRQVDCDRVPLNRADPNYDPAKDPDLRANPDNKSADCFFCWRSFGAGSGAMGLLGLLFYLLPKLRGWALAKSGRRQAELIEAVLRAIELKR